jgi:hypothetical protein
MTGRTRLRKLAPHDSAATQPGGGVGPDTAFAVCRQDSRGQLAYSCGKMADNA